MALTVAQIEAHLGRFLRLFLTHIEPAVAEKFLNPLASALVNGGKVYIINGNLGTQEERQEAIIALAKAIFSALGYGNANDGARGQHGFENHWLPAKQRGEE